jgi:phosphoribosyl-dephospho-CoA transferase
MNAEKAEKAEKAEASEGYEPRAHDLLRLRALPPTEDRPPWLDAAFAGAPFAVVRRAEAPPGFVAVGFRGSSRSQRYGTLVPLDSIVSVSAPEDLLRHHANCPPSARATLKAFVALRRIVEQHCLESLAWGPTGSVGFELATARPAVTETSDLDLLVRVPLPLGRTRARALRDRLTAVERDLSLRIDAQLETPAGGVALDEWVEDKARVLARSASGPALIDDPWASATFI